MRIVHYYRDALRASGVSVAIGSWQRATLAAGAHSVVQHRPGVSAWAYGPDESIRHVGSGRQFEIPVGVDWLRGRDVVVLHEGWISSNYVAALLAKRRRVPYVVMTHGVYEPGVMRGLRLGGVRRWLERWYLSGASAVHVFFDDESTLVHAIAPKARCRVLTMGFDAERPSMTRRGQYLCWFGRFDPDHKGLDRLLYAYALISPSRRMPLRILGEDYNGGRAVIEDLVAKLGLDAWVEVGNAVYGRDKEDFLRGAAGFLFPSRWEGYGIALVEALAAGVPVLASDSIRMAGLLREYGAANVISFDEPLTVAIAIEGLPEMVRLGVRGRWFVENVLSWGRIVPEYLTFLGDLVEA